MSQFTLNSIEEAIEDIRRGRVVIVVDDENRENEGDFLTAARNMTPELVNFMAKEGRGLICVPLTEDRCESLTLGMMVGSNTATHETAFTISVDLLGSEHQSRRPGPTRTYFSAESQGRRCTQACRAYRSRH